MKIEGYKELWKVEYSKSEFEQVVNDGCLSLIGLCKDTARGDLIVVQFESEDSITIAQFMVCVDDAQLSFDLALQDAIQQVEGGESEEK